MESEIYVAPEDLWEFYLERNPEVFLLAENNANGVKIYLEEDETVCLPQIIVEVDGDEIACEFINANNFARVCRECYEEYLEQPSYFDQQEDIEERENELDGAVEDFLNVASNGEIAKISADIIEDCKEHFLEYLARKHEVSVYRPMFLEDEDGEFFEEYPYEYMEFEDEDNPLYKE